MHSLPRSLLLVALVGLVLACVALVGLDGPSTRAAAMRELAGRSLDDLALLAGVRDDAGVLQRDEPMPVEVIQDGGSMWILPAVEQAVDDTPWFSRGKSPHLLRIEAIEHPRALALQLHLWRAGWEIRSPEPVRVRVMPFVIVVGGLLGALTAVVIRRPILGVALWGVLAQVLLGVLAPPAELFAPQTLWVEWQRGPLLARLLPWVESMTPIELAIAAALVSLCSVLVGFDHRRSRAREHSFDLASAGVLALLGTLGTIATLEAAARSGFVASFAGWAGWLATFGLLLAWAPALAIAREQWRRQRAAMHERPTSVEEPT